MKNEEIITYVLIAVVALALGYGAFLYTKASEVTPNVNTNLSNATNTSVQVDDAKVLKLKTALEGLVKLQSNQDIKLTYTGATDRGQFIELSFTDNNGRVMPPIFISKDFQYLYQGVLKIDDFVQQVNAYLAQNQNTIQQPSATQLSKSDKPVVELFVMSYCPYGAQMEKAILPVQALLDGKADIQVKFVNYILHGTKESQENMRQYCIQQNNPDKYWSYLACFLEDGNAARCMANNSINETTISACMSEYYTKYNITDSSQQFPIYDAENTKYGVRGSPTLVVNGVTVQPNRSPEDVKNAICAAFNTPPAECSTVLSSTSESPGFGFSTSGATSSQGGCGA